VMLPTVQVQRPANGTPVTTLTPELSAVGSIDGHVDPSSLKYDYQIYDAGGAKVVDSGLVGGSYVVPAGTPQWGKVYLWTVQASDGVDYSLNPVWYQLTTQVTAATGHVEPLAERRARVRPVDRQLHDLVHGRGRGHGRTGPVNRA